MSESIFYTFIPPKSNGGMSNHLPIQEWPRKEFLELLQIFPLVGWDTLWEEGWILVWYDSEEQCA